MFAIMGLTSLQLKIDDTDIYIQMIDNKQHFREFQFVLNMYKTWKIHLIVFLARSEEHGECLPADALDHFVAYRFEEHGDCLPMHLIICLPVGLKSTVSACRCRCGTTPASPTSAPPSVSSQAAN